MRKVIQLFLLITLIIVLTLPPTPEKNVFDSGLVMQLSGTTGVVLEVSSHAPTEIWKNDSQGKYLICLNDKRTNLYVYRITKRTFKGQSSVLIRCSDGVFYINRGYI